MTLAVRPIARAPLNVLAGYYLATPAFAVADVVFGAPIRVAGLSVPGHRMAYYAAAFALGIVCRLRPRSTPFIGMAESSTNLLLLLLGILMPIWSLPDAALAGAPLDVGLSGTELVNALLSGTALISSFHRSQSAAARMMRGPRRRAGPG